MLMQPAIQDELKLTEDQRGALGDSIQEAMESMRGSFGNFRDMSDEERQAAREKMREEREKLKEPFAKKSWGSLTPNKQPGSLKWNFNSSFSKGLPPSAQERWYYTHRRTRRSTQDQTRIVAKRIQEEIAKVRAQGTKEVLADIVTETQMDKLMGKPFALKWVAGREVQVVDLVVLVDPTAGERPRRPPPKMATMTEDHARRRD